MATYEVQTDKGTYQVDTEDAPPPVSKLESLGRGAANNFPLAPQAIAGGEALLGDKSYSQNLADWNAKAAAAKAANPRTYGVGAFAGALAPLAIPGVGEALEAAPIAGNAALGAASAISNTDLSKNPEEALRQGATGALVGGATAGVLGKMLPSVEGMTEASNRLANKSVGYAPGILGEMTPAEQQANGAFLREAGLVGKDKQEVFNAAKKLFDQYGKKIGEIGQGTEEAGLHLSPEEAYGAIQKMENMAKQNIDSPLLNGRELGAGYQEAAEALRKLPANPTWTDIQTLKENVGKFAFKPNGTVRDDATKDLYFTLKDMLDNIAKKAQDNPNLSGEYKEALANYTKMHPVMKGLEKSLDAELRGHAGNGLGVLHPARLIGQLPGKARAIIGAALAPVHPMWAAAAALPEIMNPAIQSNIAAGIAKVAPIAQKITTQLTDSFITSKLKDNPGVFGNYAPVLQDAAKRGPQSLAITHNLLQQRDQDYQRKLEEIRNSDETESGEAKPNLGEGDISKVAPENRKYREGLEAYENGDSDKAMKIWESDPNNHDSKRSAEHLRDKIQMAAIKG